MKNQLVRFMLLGMLAFSVVTTGAITSPAVVVHAEEKSVSLGADATGTLSEDGKTLVISGTGSVIGLVRSDDDLGWAEEELSDQYSDTEYVPLFSESEVKAIETIIIEEGITRIGDGVFYTNETNGTSGPSNATVIQLPSTLESIGENAFEGMAVRNVVIPDNVTLIEDRAFAVCKSMTSLTIGSGITSIPTGAFMNAYSLKNIIIPDTVTSIAENAFKVIDRYGTLASSTLKVNIGSGVTNISENAFGYTYPDAPETKAKLLVETENPVALAYDWEGSGYTFATDSGNSEGVTVTGTISAITSVDVTVPIGGINFGIDEAGNISAQGIVIESNTPAPLSVNIIGVEALEAGDETDGLIATTATAPTLVPVNTYSIEEWNNLSKNDTHAQIALSLKQVDVIDGDAATSLSELTTDTLKVVTPIELGNLTGADRLAHLESGYGTPSVCGINLETDSAFTNYGKAWGNADDVVFRYLTTLEFALDN